METITRFGRGERPIWTGWVCQVRPIWTWFRARFGRGERPIWAGFLELFQDTDVASFPILSVINFDPTFGF